MGKKSKNLHKSHEITFFQQNFSFPKEKNANFGYWIASPFWNKGYMTECLKAVNNFGFKELNISKIHAQHMIDNKASGKVMQKAGMIQEGTRELIVKDGSKRVLVQYGAIKN